MFNCTTAHLRKLSFVNDTRNRPHLTPLPPTTSHLPQHPRSPYNFITSTSRTCHGLFGIGIVPVSLIRIWSCEVPPGAIIGDGDRKRALIVLLGLSPWYGTIFLFLEQIAPSTVAHARTCCEDFCVCREGEMTSVRYFWPATATVWWNFTSVFSS